MASNEAWKDAWRTANDGLSNSSLKLKGLPNT
ncbi:hypothetical protein CCACVL1_03964 [Corchorus capsularis]|uniref:Uncharacterized protein n=1 Tax=Corchorus capsularis TaxID=210143 RepID=A0A1R3JVW4_COCAP|nr:hypothetical protein CCACVL1_03964 [Corchorus capsularis]